MVLKALEIHWRVQWYYKIAIRPQIRQNVWSKIRERMQQNPSTDSGLNSISPTDSRESFQQIQINRSTGINKIQSEDSTEFILHIQ